MTGYSVQLRHIIFVKGYAFFPFARNTWKNIVKNKGKNLSCKYSQKPLGHHKQSATDSLKSTSKRAIQKTAEGSDDLIGNKTADEITQAILHKLVQKQLKVEQEIQNFIKKYLKEDTYVSRKKAASY